MTMYYNNAHLNQEVTICGQNLALTNNGLFDFNIKTLKTKSKFSCLNLDICDEDKKHYQTLEAYKHAYHAPALLASKYSKEAIDELESIFTNVYDNIKLDDTYDKELAYWQSRKKISLLLVYVSMSIVLALLFSFYKTGFVIGVIIAGVISLIAMIGSCCYCDEAGKNRNDWEKIKLTRTFELLQVKIEQFNENFGSKQEPQLYIRVTSSHYQYQNYRSVFLQFNEKREKEKEKDQDVKLATQC